MSKYIDKRRLEQKLKDFCESYRKNFDNTNMYDIGYEDCFSALQDLVADTCEVDLTAIVNDLEKVICENTYPDFDKNGKPVIIWNTDGYKRLEDHIKTIERN